MESIQGGWFKPTHNNSSCWYSRLYIYFINYWITWSDIFATTLAHQCVVCGLHGSKTCGKCKAIHYCSREHQTSHWTIGQHKLHCGATDLSAEAVAKGIKLCRDAVLFPEYEIVSESETLPDSKEQDTLTEGSCRF